MRMKFSCLTLCASITFSCCASAKDLPDACGDDSIHFHVTTQPGQPLSDPPPGHARVVFIESVDRDFCLGCNPITTRIGIDGAWVGANNDHSYFVSDVLPGKHQVCADWQRLVVLKVHVDTFTAEPGKTYFYLVRVTDRSDRARGGRDSDQKIRLYQLGDSQGPFLLKDADLSTATIYR